MPEGVHPGERDQHRQRDRRGHDEPPAQVAEGEQQHRDDQHAALEQVLPTVPMVRSTSSVRS
jgi:hypothetical protein